MSEKEQNGALEVQFASRYPRVLELGAYRRLYNTLPVKNGASSSSGTEAEEIEQPSGVAVDEVHLHPGDDVSPVQQKSTVANKSAVHLSGQKDVQGSNVKDPGAAICGGDGLQPLHLVVSDSDEEGPAPAPNYVRPPHSLRDKGAVEQLTAWISQWAPARRRPAVLPNSRCKSCNIPLSYLDPVLRASRHYNDCLVSHSFERYHVIILFFRISSTVIRIASRMLSAWPALTARTRMSSTEFTIGTA